MSVVITRFQRWGAAPVEPGVYDPALPFGGRYYGTGKCGDRIGNEPIGDNAKAVIAAAATIKLIKAGNLTHVRMHERLNPSLTASGTSVGYGDGLCTAWLEVRPALANGKPDMSTLLGRTANYTPRDYLGAHPRLALQSPTAVDDDWISIVKRNSMAQTAIWATGTCSFNTIMVEKPLDPRGGPFWGQSRVWETAYGTTLAADPESWSWVESKTSSSASPESHRGHRGWFGDLTYSDGRVFGQPISYANTWDEDTGAKLIDGNAGVRQRWRMPADQTFVAKGAHVRMMARSAAPDLDLILKNGAGTVIETAPINPALITRFTDDSLSLETIIIPSTAGAAYDASIVQFYVPFATNRTFAGDAYYSAELRGSSGSRGYAWPVYNGRRAGDYSSIECFLGSVADTASEFTNDNGSTWTRIPVANGSANYTDLQILFEAA